MRRILMSLCLSLAIASIAGAWSTKEHIQLTRIAVDALIDDPNTPAEMRRVAARRCPSASTWKPSGSGS